jgi:hypothetical protein
MDLRRKLWRAPVTVAVVSVEHRSGFVVIAGTLVLDVLASFNRGGARAVSTDGLASLRYGVRPGPGG